MTGEQAREPTIHIERKTNKTVVQIGFEAELDKLRFQLFQILYNIAVEYIF